MESTPVDKALKKSLENDSANIFSPALDALDQLEADKLAKVKSLTQQTATLKEEHEHLKAQLAKESLKFQHLAERKTTQQVLVSQNASSIDGTFSTDKSGYIYRGPNACCFDALSKKILSQGTGVDDISCKHELCSRAKTTGISGTELDTLKWYDMRIRNGKTQRMRTALMKQREVELGRIKQADDEEQAVWARKKAKKGSAPPGGLAAASTSILVRGVDAQDVDTLIFQTRMALMHAHKYSSMFYAQKRNHAELERCADERSWLQLQKAQSGADYDQLMEQQKQVESRTITWVKDEEWYADKIAEAIAASSRHMRSAFWRDFDLDFDSTDPEMMELCNSMNGLMKELGMDVFNDLEHSQAALRRCMSFPRDQLPRPVQKIVDHIQEVIVKAQRQHISKKSLSPDASDPNTPSDDPERPPQRRLPDSMSLLGELRSALYRKLAPQAMLDSKIKDLSKTWTNLLDIETDALGEIYQENERSWLQPPTEVFRGLRKIIETFVGKSHMPQITAPTLNALSSTFVDMSTARIIIDDLDKTDDPLLDVMISGMVFARAEKKSNWLMEAFEAVEATFETVYTQPLPERILQALGRVQASIEARLKAVSYKASPAMMKGDKVQSVDSTPESKPTIPEPARETPTVVRTSIIPTRRKLLPRGERHLNHFETTEAAVEVACMGPETAKKMSDFCILQHEAYECAGLPVPVEVMDRKKYTRRLQNSKTASHVLKKSRTSNFSEDFSEGFRTFGKGAVAMRDMKFNYAKDDTTPSQEATTEAMDAPKKQSETVKEMVQRQNEEEQTLLEKAERQTAAIQAQIEAIRQLQDTPEQVGVSTAREPVDVPRMTERGLLELFATYDKNVNAVTDFLPGLTQDDYGKEDDLRIEVACRIQLQCFDSVRMMQLMAEHRGWKNMAEQMGRCLVDCGFEEDREGHFPDYWGNDESDDEGDWEDTGEENGEEDGVDVPLPDEEVGELDE